MEYGFGFVAMITFCSATRYTRLTSLYALVIKASIVDLTAVVSGSDKFMSFCVVCLVTARESNFPASAGLFGYSKSE